MTTRALALWSRLLTAALASAVFCGVETGCCGSWSDAVDFELDTDADLNAVVAVNDGVIIATADGQVIHASSDPSLAELSQDVEYSVGVPLNAVTALQDQVWTVGDNGTVLQKAGDGDWEIVDLGTHARLHDVAAVDDGGTVWLVIVGDGVVRVQDLESGEWFTPPEPSGGWGELRAVFGDSGWIWAVGAGGIAWRCPDPTEAWTAENVGLGVLDLNGGGSRMRSDPFTWVVGDQGSLAYLDGARWTVVATGVDEDLLAFAGGLALARDGRLFKVFEGGLHRVDKAKGLNRGLFNNGTDVVVVGEGGRGRDHRVNECPGL
jgi:hypothetical protein